jgi:allantoicase
VQWPVLIVDSSGKPGVLEQVEIDTAHFKGNFPNSCEMHGICFDAVDSSRQIQTIKGEDWTLILPRTKLGPHRQHCLRLEDTEAKIYTHVKLTIYPDGGLQRIRVIGRISNAFKRTSTTLPLSEQIAPPAGPVVLPVVPLTPEAFAPFGQVLQAYGDHTTAPKGVRITPANGGSASKFHKLALLDSSYPPESGATTGISIYRCNPSTDIAEDGSMALKVLERHRFTNQAFVPMGQEKLDGSGWKYIVVVSQNGEDDKPDLRTLRAFVASSAQGVVYGKAIWRESIISSDRNMLTDISGQDQPMTVIDQVCRQNDF